MSRFKLILVIALFLSLISSSVLAQVPAFPGAEGFGATTRGGRGGRVIEVTNLQDGGPGSLRNAIEATGKRIVVFRVGGTIELNDGLNILSPYITIAGQTAPGGGICIKNGTHEGTTLRLGTHDIIVRGLRIRPGPGGEPDGIYVPGSGYNIVIDHCSISWAVDENVTAAAGAHDVTIQWCLISQGLLQATHHKGKHSMGLMFGSGASDDSYNFSAHHNLLTHNFRRNPLVQIVGTLDFVNNVIYNWGDHTWSGYVSWIDNDTKLNYVGNYVKPGPESNRSKSAVDVDNSRSTSQIGVYVKGSLSHHRPTYDEPEKNVVHPADWGYIVDVPYTAPNVTTLSATDAFNLVLANAGAIIPKRDTVDLFAVQSLIDSAAGIINNPAEFGGYPQLAEGTPPVDTDHDGMPDDWETENGLNPDANDANGRDLDPDYDNIEVYINSLIPSPITGTLYKLDVDTSGFGSVNPSGGLFLEGQKVELTAIPGRGWMFDHWTGDLSGSQNPDTLLMDSDKNVTAVFINDPNAVYDTLT
ncbi:hypothetical protein GF337_09810, partial [candidate division KSB1 bacterium]|nr:hypothetical protein [candidate division KSB1 bacterium]